ncbi:MAG: helix-turn-helix domain-containing protein [Prevotella sp.]
MELTTYIGILVVLATLFIIVVLRIMRLKHELEAKLTQLRSLIDVWQNKKILSYNEAAEHFIEEIEAEEIKKEAEEADEEKEEAAEEAELTTEEAELPAEEVETPSIEETEEEEKKAEPSETSRMLFARIVRLMEVEHIYTDEDLTRDMLAKRLGTNYKYVVKAIKDCDNGNSLINFVNTYRLRHATRLLTETSDPIVLVAELSGFSQRTLTRLFQTQYGMSPAEYRRKKA